MAGKQLNKFKPQFAPGLHKSFLVIFFMRCVNLIDKSVANANAGVAATVATVANANACCVLRAA